ncbi:GlxA family transcriptional regulator [Aromatoleum evansii]|uniref:GlxA family transcriptional regulator n=1 Tax=Aromatoleum evansii TaxID=59406 RepID=UPI00145F5D45|nr:helix-turn-helix domain-containing protein [Aromatoleum evansii]NMG32012.1 helix-turn-helix domain-containing protein [Aromatoleum evansii]
MTITGPNRTTGCKTVALLAYDGCQGSAIASLIEVLDIANLYGARGDPRAEPLFRWGVVSPDGRAPVAMGGLDIAVGGSPASVPAPDLVFIPGLHFTGDVAHFMQQIASLAQDCGAWLRAQHEGGRVVAVSCAGAFVLAESGLLDGRKATTSWWLGKLFRARYPRVDFREGELVTQDGRILSSGAFTACLDLALRIVEHFGGPALALSCAKVLLIHAKRDSQFPYMTLQARVAHQDELVLRAESHIRSHVRETLSVEQLAAELATTPRTLNRRFREVLGCSPKQYIQDLRVEGAKRLLESTDLDFGEIVERVGYVDPRSFRRIFERATKVSPSLYRRMFSISQG